MDPLGLVQILVGGVTALFIPGYAWVRFLFYKKDIDSIEKFALSVALSIAIVPLTIFYLNKFFGVKINFLNSVLVILILTAIPLLLLYLKKIRKFNL